MAHDYKNISEAKSKSKPKAKKKNQDKTKTPKKLSGGFLLFAGIVIGSFVSFLVYLSLKTDVENTPFAEPSIIAQPQGPEVKKTEPIEEKSRFDFYAILPERKIEVPVEEVAPEEKTMVREVERIPQVKTSEPQKTRPSRLYILQAGSFSRFKDADKRKANLAFLGVASKIHAITNNNRTMYRVQVGPFSHIKKVNEIESLLKQKKIPSLLMKIKG